MPHGRKQECDLPLVMLDIGDLLDHLGHQHNIGLQLQIRQTRQAL